MYGACGASHADEKRGAKVLALTVAVTSTFRIGCVRVNREMPAGRVKDSMRSVRLVLPAPSRGCVTYVDKQVGCVRCLIVYQRRVPKQFIHATWCECLCGKPTQIFRARRTGHFDMNERVYSIAPSLFDFADVRYLTC